MSPIVYHDSCCPYPAMWTTLRATLHPAAVAVVRNTGPAKGEILVVFVAGGVVVTGKTNSNKQKSGKQCATTKYDSARND